MKLVPFPGDQVSEAGLSVLKQALINQDKVGVVRFVKRANDAPQLGALLPTSDVKENALVGPSAQFSCMCFIPLTSAIVAAAALEF